MKTFRVTSLKYVFVACIVLCAHIFSEAKVFNEDDCDESDDDTKCMNCEIKKMSGSSLKLSQATIDHIGKTDNLKSEKHSKDNLQVFHCRCVYKVRII